MFVSILYVQTAILFFLNALFKPEPPAETNIVERGPMLEEPIGGKSMLNIDKNSKKTKPFFSNFLDPNFSY